MNFLQVALYRKIEAFETDPASGTARFLSLHPVPHCVCRSMPLLARRVALSNKRHCLSQQICNCIGLKVSFKVGPTGPARHTQIGPRRPDLPRASTQAGNPTDCLAHGRAGGTARQARAQPQAQRPHALHNHNHKSRAACYATTSPKGPQNKTKQYPEHKRSKTSIGDRSCNSKIASRSTVPMLIAKQRDCAPPGERYRSK